MGNCRREWKASLPSVISHVLVKTTLLFLAILAAIASATETCNQITDIQISESLDEETARDKYGRPACSAFADTGTESSQPAGPDGMTSHGELVRQRRLPWMVSISKAGVHYCGGVLMNKMFVVTAKHCLFNNYGQLLSPLGDLLLTLGVNRISNLSEGTAQTFRVASAAPHDTADVAVLKLDKAARLNEFVWPIWFRAGCTKGAKNPLYGPYAHKTGLESAALAAGWGASKEGDRIGTADLMQQQMKLRDDQACIDAYKTTSRPFDHLTMICAGGECLDADNDCVMADTCQGDSGGPLMLQQEGRWQLFGITSYGRGCARKAVPGVYAFVYRIREWLEQQIKL